MEGVKLLATNDYHFAIVDAPAPTAQQARNTPGPLRPLLTAPPVALSVSVSAEAGTRVGVSGSCSVFSVATSGGATGNTSAMYVKPMLLDAGGKQLAYVAFDKAFVTIRPGSSTDPTRTVVFTLTQSGTNLANATHVCAEAWNAPRACAPCSPEARRKRSDGLKSDDAGAAHVTDGAHTRVPPGLRPLQPQSLNGNWTSTNSSGYWPKHPNGTAFAGTHIEIWQDRQDLIIMSDKVRRWLSSHYENHHALTFLFISVGQQEPAAREHRPRNHDSDDLHEGQ